MCKLYQRWGRQAVWPLSKSPTLPLYYKSLPATALHWKIFPICTVQLLWPSPVEASSSLARLCLARLCPPTCTKWGKENDSRPSKPWLCQALSLTHLGKVSLCQCPPSPHLWGSSRSSTTLRFPILRQIQFEAVLSGFGVSQNLWQVGGELWKLKAKVGLQGRHHEPDLDEGWYLAP